MVEANYATEMKENKPITQLVALKGHCPSKQVPYYFDIFEYFVLLCISIMSISDFDSNQAKN